MSGGILVARRGAVHQMVRAVAAYALSHGGAGASRARARPEVFSSRDLRDAAARTAPRWLDSNARPSTRGGLRPPRSRPTWRPHRAEPPICCASPARPDPAQSAPPHAPPSQEALRAPPGGLAAGARAPHAAAWAPRAAMQRDRAMRRRRSRRRRLRRSFSSARRNLRAPPRRPGPHPRCPHAHGRIMQYEGDAKDKVINADARPDFTNCGEVACAAANDIGAEGPADGRRCSSSGRPQAALRRRRW